MAATLPRLLLAVGLAAAAAAAEELPAGCRVEGGPGPATLRFRVGDDFANATPQRILREMQSQMNDGTRVELDDEGSYPAGAGLTIATRGRPVAWTLAQVAAATGRAVILRHTTGEMRILPPAHHPAAPAPAPVATLPTTTTVIACPPPHHHRAPWPVVVPVVSYGVGWRVHRHGWLGWRAGVPLRDWRHHCR